jgi:hypothetical protein
MVAARNLYYQLTNNSIDVWLDYNVVDYGDQINPSIQKGIDNCCVFIPVISRKSTTGDERRIYRAGWSYAIARAERSGSSPVLLPVNLQYIEDSLEPTGNQSSGSARSMPVFGVPGVFRERNGLTWMVGDELPPEFINRIKSIQRDRRNGKTV